MTVKLVIVLFILTMYCHAKFIKKIDPRRKAKAQLYNDLASHAVINNSVGPVTIADEITVNFVLWPFWVTEVVDSKQTMEVVMSIQMNWIDEDLAWNKEDYANISIVKMPSRLLWFPEINFPNSPDNEKGKFQVPDYFTLSSEGLVVSSTGSIVKSVCHFDFTHYPFDVQSCTVLIGVDYKDGIVELTASFMGMTIADEVLTSSTEWEIIDRQLAIRQFSETNKNVEVTVKIKRAQLYYIMFILMPNLVTALLTLMVFWIPPGSGEKMSFLVSIFLSMMLFLNMGGETFPRNLSSSDSFPRMVIFLIFVFLEGVLAMGATIFVMRRYKEELNAQDEVSTSDKANIGNNQDRTVMDQDTMKTSKTEISSLRSDDSGTKWFSKIRGKVSRVCNKETFEVTSFEGARKGARCHSTKLRAEALDKIFFAVFCVVCVPFYNLVFII